MTRAGETVEELLDEYIEALGRTRGRKPSVLHVTRRQWVSLYIHRYGQDHDPKKRNKPLHHRGILVQAVD